MAESVIYLGLQFNKEGYCPSPVILPKIENHQVPTSPRDVQSFLGKINYYSTHIPNLAAVAAPLYLLTQKAVPFVWKTQHQESFEKLKAAFESNIVLTPVQPGTNFDLYTDASGVACGAALLQNNKPIVYYSKKFSPVEQRYSAHEREALPIATAIKHFRVILTGATFRLFKDHKPLNHWLTRPPVNDRHARWLVSLQDMNFDIHYVEGKYNVLADFLSRPIGAEKSSFEVLHNEVNVNAIALGVLSEKLRDAQTDSFVKSCNIEPTCLKVIDGYYITNESGRLSLLDPSEFTEV